MNCLSKVLSRGRQGREKYSAVFLANVRAQLAYRGIVIETVFDYFMQCLLLILLWRAIYSDSPTLYGRSFAQMKEYLLASCAFSSIYAYPSIHFLSVDIRNGEIAYTLTRPLDFQAQFFFKNLGRVAASLLVVLPVFFLSSLLVGAVPGGSPLFSLVSLVMAIALCISFDFLLGILCFWTENSWGISLVRQVALQYLSGAFMPLDCFPPKVAEILRDYLPFSGIVYFPVEFLKQPYSWAYFLRRLGIQGLWCLLFLAVGRLFYGLARKKVTVNGG